jgi:hypothetical protein
MYDMPTRLDFLDSSFDWQSFYRTQRHFYKMAALPSILQRMLKM